MKRIKIGASEIIELKRLLIEKLGAKTAEAVRDIELVFDNLPSTSAISDYLELGMPWISDIDVVEMLPSDSMKTIAHEIRLGKTERQIIYALRNSTNPPMEMTEAELVYRDLCAELRDWLLQRYQFRQW